MPVVISDALVLALADAAIPATHPRILYDDIFSLDDTTLVASTQAAGFEKENAVDRLTYDFWQPTASPGTLEAQAAAGHDIDYLMVAAHNLGTVGARIKAHYHDGAGWVEIVSEVAPGSDRVLVFLFEEIAASRIRVTTTYAGDAPSLGVVMAGKALAMERGVTIENLPTPFARKTAFSTNYSEAGQLLGSSIRREGVEIPIAFGHLTAAWVREYFEPFIAHARTKRTFGWVWSPVDYPDDVAYCVVEKDIPAAHKGLQDRMNVEFVARGMLE